MPLLASQKAADMAHKAVGGVLIAFSAFGAFNVVNMVIFKVRQARKADRLLEAETSLDFAAASAGTSLQQGQQ
ncbi:hypothetical protein BC831DRAFT_510957 [Entophlyctis helioformis]|nr:hypothetical protein BC831DRAFT_510957 [Entophlyctis helioformis]